MNYLRRGFVDGHLVVVGGDGSAPLPLGRPLIVADASSAAGGAGAAGAGAPSSDCPSPFPQVAPAGVPPHGDGGDGGDGGPPDGGGWKKGGKKAAGGREQHSIKKRGDKFFCKLQDIARSACNYLQYTVPT